MLKQVSGLFAPQCPGVICGTPLPPPDVVGGEPAPGCDAIGDFKDEVPHARHAVATQDIALHIGEVDHGAHQPNPSCLRT